MAKKVILGNAISGNMLNLAVAGSLRWVPMTAEEVAATDFESVVGHPSTAELLTAILGKEVAFNRATISLDEDTVLLLAQYVGPRLEEGTTVLPEGAKLTFARMELS